MAEHLTQAKQQCVAEQYGKFFFFVFSFFLPGQLAILNRSPQEEARFNLELCVMTAEDAAVKREAYLLLEEGASAPQIDKAMTDFGMPMGPFAMQDLAGIDVSARIRQYLKSIGKSRAEGPQSAVMDRLYELGRYGQKTGAGWYRYEDGSRAPIPDPLIDKIATEEAAKRGVIRRSICDEEIVARITTALVNEGARVIEEGFATRPGDIDVIYVYGYGFPRYRGGPMYYADTIGLATVLRRVNEYRARLGDYWTPTALLEKLVVADSRFSDIQN